MDYRLLGRTGLRVSPLCFGTMSFGGDADEETSAALYAAVRDKGINFLDCADAYQKGRAEEILGRLMAHEREQLVVTTKVHFNDGSGPNAGGLNRRHMTRAVEGSLKRLGTDRVEILFMHHWGPADADGGGSADLRGPRAIRQGPAYRTVELDGLADREVAGDPGAERAGLVST